MEKKEREKYSIFSASGLQENRREQRAPKVGGQLEQYGGMWDSSALRMPEYC